MGRCSAAACFRPLALVLVVLVLFCGKAAASGGCSDKARPILVALKPFRNADSSVSVFGLLTVAAHVQCVVDAVNATVNATYVRNRVAHGVGATGKGTFAPGKFKLVLVGEAPHDAAGASCVASTAATTVVASCDHISPYAAKSSGDNSLFVLGIVGGGVVVVVAIVVASYMAQPSAAAGHVDHRSDHACAIGRTLAARRLSDELPAEIIVGIGMSPNPMIGTQRGGSPVPELTAGESAADSPAKFNMDSAALDQGPRLEGAAGWAAQLATLPPSQVTKKARLSRGSPGAVYAGQFRGRNIVLREVHGLGNDAVGTDPAIQCEAALIGRLLHPNVLPCFGICYKDRAMYLVSEYCPVTMADFIVDTTQDTSLPVMSSIAVQVARGMSYLHSKGVIHRNLTPFNVLIAADGRICVCDFGAAQVLENPALDKGRDARAYYAPEVVHLDVADRILRFTPQADVYSFGVLLWVLFTKEEPYPDLEPEDIAAAVRTGSRPRIPRTFSPSAKQLLVRCWHRDPSKRPTFADIEAAMLEREFLSRVQRSTRHLTSPSNGDDDNDGSGVAAVTPTSMAGVRPWGVSAGSPRTSSRRGRANLHGAGDSGGGGDGGVVASEGSGSGGRGGSGGQSSVVT